MKIRGINRVLAERILHEMNLKENA
jgi:hypothetical protein